jgi:hypothetical protein
MGCPVKVVIDPHRDATPYQPPHPVTPCIRNHVDLVNRETDINVEKPFSDEGPC